MSSATDHKLNILVLCSGASCHIGTVLDHLAAFVERSRHNISLIDAAFAAEMGIDPDWYDVLTFHYSVVLSDPTHIRPKLASRIRSFTGLKIAFIQDEYRWIDRQNAAIEDLGISVVYTVTNPEVTRRIYRTDYFNTVRIEHTLTGFVPESLLNFPTPAYSNRPIDVSYRARRAPAWYGAFAEQKFVIGERFRRDAVGLGLICDIESAEDRRLYGIDWINLIASSKATLGSESGVSFVDFSGEVQERSEAYERANPDVPQQIIRDMFLDGIDGDVSIKVISPRIFEAAALRTLLVLYPGTYSGVLVSQRHYVPLAVDHSNLPEVVAVIQSPERANQYIEAAYHEVACNRKWWLGTLIEEFDAVVSEEYERRVAGRRDLRPIRERLASELAGQWSSRTELDAAVSQLHSYKSAHDIVANEYKKLADEYQKLEDEYQKLASQFQNRARRLVYRYVSSHRQ